MKFLKKKLIAIFFKPNHLSSAKHLLKLREKTLAKQHSKNLESSLKQLEFIFRLEMHVDKNKLENYSLSYLLHLANIRHNAEINTLKLISFCKKQFPLVDT